MSPLRPPASRSPVPPSPGAGGRNASAPAEPITLVLADDHPFVLHGVAALLETQADLALLRACPDGEAALAALRELRPRVAVLDVNMPGRDGLEVLGACAAEGLGVRVILLTATISDGQVLRAVEAGARGLLLKSAAPQELARGVRAVAAGDLWFPDGLVAGAAAREARRGADRARLETLLTPREREVMLLAAEGLPNKEVGRRLGLTEGTVKAHLHNIYQKTGATNRTALTALAPALRESART